MPDRHHRHTRGTAVNLDDRRVIVDQVLASLALAQAPGHGVFAHAAQLRAIEQ